MSRGEGRIVKFLEPRPPRFRDCVHVRALARRHPRRLLGCRRLLGRKECRRLLARRCRGEGRVVRRRLRLPRIIGYVRVLAVLELELELRCCDGYVLACGRYV